MMATPDPEKHVLLGVRTNDEDRLEIFDRFTGRKVFGLKDVVCWDTWDDVDNEPDVQTATIEVITDIRMDPRPKPINGSQ